MRSTHGYSGIWFRIVTPLTPLVRHTKNLVQQRHHKLTNLWLCARPWPGHIQHLHIVALKESLQLLRRPIISGAEMQARFAVLPGKLYRSE